MTIKYSKASLAKFEGLHPDLVRVLNHVAEICPPELDFKILNGIRTIEEQKEFVKEGKSKTMDSRHLRGMAVDVCRLKDGKATWDIPEYAKLAEVFKQASRDLRVPIIWGGDWDNDGDYKDETFIDADHFELYRKAYP